MVTHIVIDDAGIKFLCGCMIGVCFQLAILGTVCAIIFIRKNIS